MTPHLYPMSKPQLEAALREAVSTSNEYFDIRDWRMAEHWHLKAVELQAALDAANADVA